MSRTARVIRNGCLTNRPKRKCNTPQMFHSFPIICIWRSDFQRIVFWVLLHKMNTCGSRFRWKTNYRASVGGVECADWKSMVQFIAKTCWSSPANFVERLETIFKMKCFELHIVSGFAPMLTTLSIVVTCFVVYWLNY